MKNSRSRLSLLVVVASSAFLLFLIPSFLSDRVVYVSAPQVEQRSSGLPVRLAIAALNVNALIELVGLTPDGAMDVPKGPDNAAWYDLGTRPGEIGNAVIAGHSGWKDGIPAVFDALNQVNIGDRIYVTDEGGATTIFIVRKIREYDPNADATDVFDSSDGKSHLNLITCAGVWDTFSRSSSKRLVVFTDKE